METNSISRQRVVSMFQDVFKQQGVELPEITKFIIKTSGSLGSYGLLILITLIWNYNYATLIK